LDSVDRSRGDFAIAKPSVVEDQRLVNSEPCRPNFPVVVSGMLAPHRSGSAAFLLAGIADLVEKAREPWKTAWRP
jgi:hypothetical protein